MSCAQEQNGNGPLDWKNRAGWYETPLPRLVNRAAVPPGGRSDDGEQLSCSCFVLKCGTLIDGVSAEVRHNVDVLIQGDRIVRVGSADDVAAHVPTHHEVVDLSARTVMPGFIDVHVHPFIWTEDYQIDSLKLSTAAKCLHAVPALQRMLYHGWTSLRVAGDSDTGWGIIDLRKSFERGEHVGPRLFGAAHYLSITGGGGDLNQLAPEPVVACGSHGNARCNARDAVIVDGPEEMRKAVRVERKAGSDWIKLLVTGAFMSVGDSPRDTHFSTSEIEMAVEEAARLGMRGVMAHAHGSDGIRVAIRAGVASIEHGSFIDAAGVELMLAKDCVLVPTLTIGEYSSASYSADGAMAKMLALQRSAEAESRACIEAAFRAGVKVALGSDWIGWDPACNHREFELMHEFGLPAMRCLQAGTSYAAALLGRGGDLGSVQVGRIADIVALDGNPLDDMRATGRVRWVMQAGRIMRED